MSQEPPSRQGPKLIIREAAAADAGALASLICDLGYPVTESEIAERLGQLSLLGEPPLVAALDGVVGCLSWHVTPVLHRPRPVGRITMLVVAEPVRGRGVGAALVEAAAVRLRAAGCGLVEVTSNARRTDAHLFYERLGYERTSFRFMKPL